MCDMLICNFNDASINVIVIEHTLWFRGKDVDLHLESANCKQALFSNVDIEDKHKLAYIIGINSKKHHLQNHEYIKKSNQSFNELNTIYTKDADFTHSSSIVRSQKHKYRRWA